MNEMMIVQVYEDFKTDCKARNLNYNDKELLMLMLCSRLDRLSLDLDDIQSILLKRGVI